MFFKQDQSEKHFKNDVYILPFRIKNENVNDKNPQHRWLCFLKPYKLKTIYTPKGLTVAALSLRLYLQTKVNVSY